MLTERDMRGVENAFEYVYQTAAKLHKANDPRGRALESQGMKLQQAMARLGVDCWCAPRNSKHECVCSLQRPPKPGTRASKKRFSGVHFDGAHCRDSEGKFVPVVQCTGRRPKRK